MLSISLPYLPPREFSPNSRVHWRVRHKVGLRVQDDVMALVREQGWDQPPLEKSTISITWIFPDNRRRDIDNLLASTKPILDALTKDKSGVIVDDSWQHITLVLTYEKGDEPQTRIEITA